MSTAIQKPGHVGVVDGRARVTLSTRNRTQAPGLVIARSRGAKALGVPYDSTRAKIVAQKGGEWMTWEVWT